MRPTGAPPAAQPAGPGLRQIAPSLVVNALCPWLAFQVLSRAGVATVPALCATAVFPIGATLVSWVRTRSPDGIGIISLVFIAVGVASSLISGDVRFFLVKESFFTGLFGLVWLGSLLLSRPLMFVVAGQFSTGGDPQRRAWWSGLWQYPRFRQVMRLMTAVWGVAYLVEASIRVAFALLLPPAAVITLSPILGIGVTLGLIYWTTAYGRRESRRAEEPAAAQPSTDTTA
jgi:intracellular septation protein A